MLIAEAVSYANSDDLLTFRAILAWFQDDAETTAYYAQLALIKKEEPLEKALIYRHLAEAAVALGLQDWESYFTQAIQESTGRGRGITRNLYAVALDNQGREVAARSEYLLAVQDLRGDDHWLADTWGGFFSQFLWADLLRQEGDLQAVQEMIERADERQFKRWQNTGLLFPEAYAMRGVVIPRPPEWQVRVSLDGPVRAWMHGVELPLRSTHPEAGLLAPLAYLRVMSSGHSHGPSHITWNGSGRWQARPG